MHFTLGHRLFNLFLLSPWWQFFKLRTPHFITVSHSLFRFPSRIVHDATLCCIPTSPILLNFFPLIFNAPVNNQQLYLPTSITTSVASTYFLIYIRFLTYSLWHDLILCLSLIWRTAHRGLEGTESETQQRASRLSFSSRCFILKAI